MFSKNKKLIRNRGKKSIMVNLKSNTGKKVFKTLIEWCDVLIDPYRPGVLKSLGFGFDSLKELNKGIIYCCVSSYGANGPMSSFAAHDINYAALSGILSTVVGVDHKTGKSMPAMPGVFIVSIILHFFLNF